MYLEVKMTSCLVGLESCFFLFSNIFLLSWFFNANMGAFCHSFLPFNESAQAQDFCDNDSGERIIHLLPNGNIG